MKPISISVVIIGMLVAARAVAGQAPTVAVPEPATLTFQNREIVTLRSMRGLLSPQDRVEGAQRRLRTALRTTGSDSVTVVRVDGDFGVALGDAIIFGVLQGDLEPEQQATVEATAEAAATRLDEAVRVWAAQRQPGVVARGLLYSLIALALAAGAVWLLTRLRFVLVKRLSDAAARRLDARAVRGFNLLDPLLRLMQLAVGVGRGFAVAAVLYVWLTYTFSQFPLTAPLGNQLADFIGDAIVTVANGIFKGIPAMLLATLILAVTRGFAHLVKTLFDTIGQGRLNVKGVYPDTAGAMRRIAVVLVWVFGIAMAFPFLPGSDSEALKGVSVLFGLMITLGSSGVISQGMSGLVVVFSRAIKENEYVRVGEFEGTVTQVGALSAKLRTPRNEEITIPNSVLVSTPTHNYSRLAGVDGVVLQAIVGIGYDASWRQVHDLLVEAARRTSGLRQTPPAYVRQAALSSFCVEYSINAHLIRPETRLAVLSDLHANIQDVFNEHEIQIMTPAFESQPPEPVLVPKGKWIKTPTRPPAA